MLFLYDLPDWLTGVIVVGTVLGLAYLGYFVFQRAFGRKLTEDNKSVGLSILGAVATINALLLAFTAVDVWNSSVAAEAAVLDEANTISEVGRDLSMYDSPQAAQAVRLLHTYTEGVITLEWCSMQRGESSPEVWNQFDRVILAVRSLEPGTSRQTDLLREIWREANQLLQQRRNRLHTSESKLSGTLWSVIVIGTMMTMLTAYVLPRTRFNLWMVGALAVSMGLVFFLIVAMDRPFAGANGVRSDGFRTALTGMQQWDAELQKTRESK